MDEAATRTKVTWREWGEDAFREAAERDRPVLLAITGFWCGWCRAMDGRTYDDPRIAATVHESTVPVRVDADERPLVRARYTMGGLPATVFTTPDGRLLASAGYLDPEDFRDVLDRVLDSWAENEDGSGRIPEPLEEPDLPGGTLTPEIERGLVGQLDATFDDDHAGWGTSAKFPLPTAVEFALGRRPEQATRTLDAVLAHLEDPADGGFFRHARERDWSDPMLEKLCSVNASLLRALAHAYVVTGNQAYRTAGERTVRFLAETLWTGEGFANSQSPGEYFSRPPAEREEAGPPPVDGATYADSTASAAGAMLTFAAYTDDERATEVGRRAIDWLLGTRTQDGVFAHARGREDGPLLVDQAAGLVALTTASQVLGSPYVDEARAVADRTIDALRTESGAFRDAIVDGPALLGRPLHPIDDNARLADALVDLSSLTGEPSYRRTANAALAAFADAADHLGVQAAGYGRAVARTLDPPLVIDVSTEPGSDLHRAALRMADHEKVVVPQSDIEGPGTASIRGRAHSQGPIKSPETLAQAVSEVLEDD